MNHRALATILAGVAIGATIIKPARVRYLVNIGYLDGFNTGRITATALANLTVAARRKQETR